MEYWDRADAGRILAEEVAGRVARPCVVAAVPRGGVVVALPIAERLSAPLTVAYARKLASPGSPGSAFGVMDEDGRALLDADRLAALELSPDELESLKAHVSREIQRQMLLYCMPPLARALPAPAVVLVDDGLVTGLTMAGAVAYARRHGAREITVVASCASSAAADRVRPAWTASCARSWPPSSARPRTTTPTSRPCRPRRCSSAWRERAACRPWICASQWIQSSRRLSRMIHPGPARRRAIAEL